jgi:hypothetical protein
MTEPAQTTDTARVLSMAALHEQNRLLLTLRSAYWHAGNERAALAVDDARNSIARALHDLQRCANA